MKKKHLFISIIIIILSVIIDLMTKSFIDNNLSLGDSIVVIKNFFYITYVRNIGAAWGLLAGNQVLLISVSIIAGILLIIYYLKGKESLLNKYGIVLVFGGMLGNLYDRITLGYVRDFLDFYIFGYDFPVFNFADMCVTIGIFMIIFDILIEEYKLWKLKK